LKVKLERATQKTAKAVREMNIVSLQDAPSEMPVFLSVTDRILQLLTYPSFPEVTRKVPPNVSLGENAIDVTSASPWGLSMRVLRAHRRTELSHRHTFRYTSPRKNSSPSRESIVASHSPDEETTACSTREGSSIFSSLRETRFEGDTSNSEINFDEEGEYVCKEDGWEDGRMRVDESECTVSGVGTDVDGLPCDIAGSVGIEVRSGIGTDQIHSPSLMPE
jgi:hypothetical protein